MPLGFGGYYTLGLRRFIELKTAQLIGGFFRLTNAILRKDIKESRSLQLPARSLNSISDPDLRRV